MGALGSTRPRRPLLLVPLLLEAPVAVRSWKLSIPAALVPEGLCCWNFLEALDSGGPCLLLRRPLRSLLLEAPGSSQPWWPLLLASLLQFLCLFGPGGLPLSPRDAVLVSLGKGAVATVLIRSSPLLGPAVQLS